MIVECSNTLKISVHTAYICFTNGRRKKGINWFNGIQKNTLQRSLDWILFGWKGPHLFLSLFLFYTFFASSYCKMILVVCLNSIRNGFVRTWLFYLIKSIMWAIQCTAHWHTRPTYKHTLDHYGYKCPKWYRCGVYISLILSTLQCIRIVFEKYISHVALQWMWFIWFHTT